MSGCAGDSHSQPRGVTELLGYGARRGKLADVEFTLIKGLFKAVLLPPVGFVFLGLLGLLIARRRQSGLVLAWLSLAALLAMSLPIVASSLTAILGVPAVFDPGTNHRAQAIVIPAGGLREYAPEYGGSTLSVLTLERVRYGAYLAKRTGLPLMVTGGQDVEGLTEAEAMRRALEQEFAISPRWVEPRSRDTRENAAFSAQLLLPQRVRRIVLVGHVFDLRRFESEFQRAGFETIAAPTGPRPVTATYWGDWVPSMRAIEASHFACYELIGNAVLAIGDVLAPLLPRRLAP